MIRRRPIQRSGYRWLAKAKPEFSQHYDTILEGAVRRYQDGREVCQDNRQGWAEYKRRIEVMVQRQSFKCCLCGKRISVADATFEHQRRRGMGGAWRDDRLENAQGKLNGASHWICNGERG